MENYKTVTTPKFERSFKKLKKRYPKIVDDYEDFLDEVEIDENLGEDIPGVVKDGNKVFKKRMDNQSANKGKSGGFRIIEYLVTSHGFIFLLDIYSKNEVDNMSAKEVKKQLVDPNIPFIEEFLEKIKDTEKPS